MRSCMYNGLVPSNPYCVLASEEEWLGQKAAVASSGASGNIRALLLDPFAKEMKEGRAKITAHASTRFTRMTHGQGDSRHPLRPREA